jgi:hypothetical protein
LGHPEDVEEEGLGDGVSIPHWLADDEIYLYQPSCSIDDDIYSSRGCRGIQVTRAS